MIPILGAFVLLAGVLYGMLRAVQAYDNGLYDWGEDELEHPERDDES